MPEKSLLQVICELVGCSFISDMPTIKFEPETWETILQIPDETFSVNEWCSAVAYVTNAPCTAETVAQAKAQLQRKK